MLKELEKYFTQKGWYAGTHPFISLQLVGGFEAFSGKASETWEYRWMVCIHENQEMGIPAIMVKGKSHQSLDDICAGILAQLKQYDEDRKAGIIKPEMHASIDPKAPHFVDWNQYSLDELSDYLDGKYKYQSTGDALAIHKLIEFYNKHKK